MSKRTEQEDQQVVEITEFCQNNKASMDKMTKQKGLEHLKCQFADVAFQIILKGYARFLKQSA